MDGRVLKTCCQVGIPFGVVCIGMLFVLMNAVLGVTPREFSESKDGPRG